MTMTTAQYLALLDTEPETLPFDLKAKALVAGKKLDTARQLDFNSSPKIEQRRLRSA